MAGGGGRWREEAGAASTPRFERAVEALLAVGVDAALAENDTELILRVCEYRRGRRLLQALGGRAPLMRAMTPPPMLREHEKKQAALDGAIAEYERQRERMDKNAMLAARAKVQAAQKDLAVTQEKVDARLAPARSLLSPGVTPLADIQAALAPSESLIYFAVGADTTGAIVITRGGARIVPLPDRATLEREARKLVAALAQPAPEVAIAHTQRQLYLPLSIPDSARDLVIAPAPPVDRIPFCLLDSQATVRYVDSGASLVAAAQLASKKGVGVLGIGNTTFASNEIRIRLTHMGNGIPVARLETAKKLAELMEDTVAVGPPATETMVRDAIASRARWRAIHFTVPGLLDAERPYASVLGLSQGPRGDGVIDLHDLLAIGLPTELSLLAACEPARGTTAIGPALHALARATQFAGSARVIAGQWWMEDKAAMTLMSNFYRYWRDGNTPAPLALRRAQSVVAGLHGWEHPKHWAGWQLWGAR
ncbi:MAG: CHAT domain-containing protein [Planctomycetota bacterium]